MTPLAAQRLRSVLIVDDSRADRLAVRRSLERHSGRDLTFWEAHCGSDALRLVEEVAVDLMVVDMHMTDTTALQLLDQLKDETGLLPFACVVVTGSTTEDLAESCLQAGAHDYIDKARLGEPTFWRAVSYALSRFSIARELHQRSTELRRLNQELERKHALQSMFLANATHELRTPVSAIAGLVELVEREPLSPIVDDYVRTIKSCCQALHASISDVLDLNRIEAGELIFETTSIDLTKVVEETVAVLSRTAGLKGLQVELRTDGLPRRVQGDGRRIHQLLLNLGGNAIKFTSEGGLEIRVQRGADGLYRFEVQDSGIGIPKDEQEKVFERYFQATNSRLGERGTGLGLSIAREIVQTMGGQMGCYSEADQGSTFWFTLPLPECGEPLEAEVAEGGDIVVPVQRRVLVAEDNPILAHILTQQLHGLNQQVTVVTNGALAIDEFHPERYDLAIFDARMPVLDGISACRELRQRYPDTVRPIFILTADSMLNEQQRQECGATAIFVKPISAAELSRLVLSGEAGSSNSRA